MSRNWLEAPGPDPGLDALTDEHGSVPGKVEEAEQQGAESSALVGGKFAFALRVLFGSN